MHTHNKTTVRSNQHQAENLTNNLRSSPSRANPQASPPRERLRGKDHIIEDQFDQVCTNRTILQVPFKVTDLKAPMTQAQLATMLKAIIDVTCPQTPNQVLGGTPSHASTSWRSRLAVSRRPFQGVLSTCHQAGSHVESGRVPNRNVYQRLGPRVQSDE